MTVRTKTRRRRDHRYRSRMKPDLQQILALCPKLNPGIAQQHLDRLEDAYLQRFELDIIAAHLKGIASLSAHSPVVVMVAKSDRNETAGECTVLAFDYPFEFSLISGVLAGSGFRIESGDVFTLQRPALRPNRRPRNSHRNWNKNAHYRAGEHGLRRRERIRDPFQQRVVIDHFRGQFDLGFQFESASAQLKDAMCEIIGLLDRGDDESVDRAKRRVNEMVTEHLSRLESDRKPVLSPVDLKIDQVDQTTPNRTCLRIVAQDTPAFLYSLSTALSLQGLSIEHVRIGGDKDWIEDEVHFVDANGKPILDPTLIERVKLSVLLTKQFTYYLETSPDPFTSLQRFERLTEGILRLPPSGATEQWLEQLGNPRTMQDLAKLLGTSDFLWEEFIHGQWESLLPIFQPHLEGRQFCPPPETVPLRLQNCLEGEMNLEEKRKRLNDFKDREVFQIDLDHILAPNADFRELSRRLTLLAENLVATSARLVYEDLVNRYGHPKTEDHRRAQYAVFGLGKLGGVALGYASDVELLFLYSGGGKTTGGQREPITNPEFFQEHARLTSQFIKTKREGIFQVDLRLRPYGSAGPLASSLQHFRSYYGPEGPAHPFERLALVRMRWIGGHPALGFAVEALRDQFVYDDTSMDMDALWDVWNKQHQQKYRAGAINAKYSAGALVDLEGAVQLLQVIHAARVPQLRTPRLPVAMEALRRADVLKPQEYADLSGCYYFLRRLINALRMLRGSAQDLFLPPIDSDEMLHLARRMGYGRADKNDARQLLEQFQQRTASVQAFVSEHFERPCPGSVISGQ